MCSGPSVSDNPKGFIDSHEVVVRVNNYKTLNAHTGTRCDVHYSFYGRSIRKTPGQLLSDGVKVCMCKCPDAYAIKSDWHHKKNKLSGVDFRWIYRERGDWWPCDVYIPPKEDFLTTFYLLGKHVPTTGFSAIIDILGFAPRQLYITGFDGFRSKIHNVNESWRAQNKGDPIGHVPERELAWLAANVNRYPVKLDGQLASILTRIGIAA